ncbi:hypothetical protein NE237_027925 [Protea cynaroides]|uniref:Uncharacterized protein n=1 Tax=Protea cynaroides TaxID=273540 RepID=A0A9Q0JUU4_9MAGN|nr:hypothetical protein NE237_027925 [Protea cynaroides]
MENSIELGSSGSELMLTRKINGGISIKNLGSREFMRYYCQKRHRSPTRDIAIAVALASWKTTVVGTSKFKKVKPAEALELSPKKEEDESWAQKVREKSLVHSASASKASLVMGSSAQAPTLNPDIQERDNVLPPIAASGE